MRMLEIATYWGGELLWLDYAPKRTDVPPGWTVSGNVAMHVREVPDAERLHGKPKPWGEMASAFCLALVLHLGLLGLGSLLEGTEDPTDGPPNVFMLGTLAGNPELDNSLTRRGGDGVEGTQGAPVPAAPRLAASSSSDPKTSGDVLPEDAIGPPTDPFDEAAHFGVLGLLDRAGSGVDVDLAASEWAGPGGDLFGRDIPSIGPEGLSGVGQGGGGPGLGIGLGRITIGAGCDETCIGMRGQGWGSAHGTLTGGHHATIVCHLPMVGTTVKSQIPAEVIQRIVRANMGRFRGCYEDALHSSPSLAGRVVVKFAIARDGSVTMVQDAGSDLPSTAAVGCIVRAFQTLSFPSADATTLVTYPLALSPE